MNGISQDLRIALRGLRGSAGFAAVAIVSLALGIGANTAIFSLVDAVLLRPLPYGDPDRVVVLWENNFARHRERNVISPSNFVEWRNRNSVFDDMAISTWSIRTLLGSGAPERLVGRSVSRNLFSVLGVSPALGRTFDAREERAPGGSTPVVISDGLWKRRFGGDPAILGRTLRTSDGAAVVVGVMPKSFRPLGNEEYWEPLPFSLEESSLQRFGRLCVGWARLKPGVSAKKAQAAMTAVAAVLSRERPDFDSGWGVQVVPLTENVVGGSRTLLFVLFATVTLVLLIACANLASVVLSRAAARSRDVAIRLALGASRARIARQAVLESLLLSLAGGAIGILLAGWALDLLVVVATDELPRLSEVHLDARAFAFAFAVSAIAGIAFGLLPLRQRRRGEDLAGALRGDGGRATAGRRSVALRGALAVMQIAVALVLTVGTGLLVRSLANLERVEAGFRPGNVLTFRLILPAHYDAERKGPAFFEELVARTGRLPRVSAAGAGTHVPLGGMDVGTSFLIEGRPAPAPDEKPVADVHRIDAGYLAAVGVPLLSGRNLSERDREGSVPVALVNRTLARQCFGTADPIGKRLRVNFSPPDAPVEIVGIVGDVKRGGLDEDTRPAIYLEQRQSPTGMMTVVLRTGPAPLPSLSVISGIVREMDPDVAIDRVATRNDLVAESLGGRRFPMYFLAPFSATALLLTAVGIYGVLSLAVRLRLREIGVRIALGAAPRHVLGLVLGRAARLTAAGLLLGGAASLLATRALRGLLFGVGPQDPLTIVAGAAAVLAIAFLASYLPARRAIRTDPIAALRQE